MWNELDMWTKLQLVMLYIITIVSAVFCIIGMIKDFKAGHIMDGCMILGILLYVCWAIFSARE